MRLRKRTAAGFNGYDPISWLAIDAFLNRAGIMLAPWEIELLEELDDIFLNPATKVVVPEPDVPEGKQLTQLVSPKDGQAVKALMGSFGSRRVVRKRKPNG